MALKKYTPEQLIQIREASGDKLRQLAEIFGVQFRSLRSKRSELRRLARGEEKYVTTEEYKRPIEENKFYKAPLPFNRPSWFNENLTQLTKGATR